MRVCLKKARLVSVGDKIAGTRLLCFLLLKVCELQTNYVTLRALVKADINRHLKSADQGPWASGV